MMASDVLEDGFAAALGSAPSGRGWSPGSCGRRNTAGGGAERVLRGFGKESVMGTQNI